MIPCRARLQFQRYNETAIENEGKGKRGSWIGVTMGRGARGVVEPLVLIAVRSS
jgi:hypothetical protein